jgi:hypothetical protein
VVNGDPLKDIALLQELENIHLVFQDGELVAGAEWKQPMDETDVIRPPKCEHSH